MEIHDTSRPRSARASGFSLIEVLIALTIFSVVAISIFQMVGQGFVIMHHARDVDRATQILQYQTENLRGSAWTDLEDMLGTRTVQVDSAGVPVAPGETGTTPFTWRSFELNQTLAQEQADLVRATLSLQWTDITGKRHTRSFFTYLTKKGLNEFYIRASS